MTKFSLCEKLTTEIYYCRKYPDLRYVRSCTWAELVVKRFNLKRIMTLNNNKIKLKQVISIHNIQYTWSIDKRHSYIRALCIILCPDSIWVIKVDFSQGVPRLLTHQFLDSLCVHPIKNTTHILKPNVSWTWGRPGLGWGLWEHQSLWSLLISMHTSWSNIKQQVR